MDHVFFHRGSQFGIAAVPERTRIVRVLLAAGAAILGGLVLALVATGASAANAADNSSFDPGFIISDDVFYNTGTMTTTTIQAFIAAKDPTCQSYVHDNTTYTCLRNYTENTTTMANRAATTSCAATSGSSKDTAASIIYRVAKACGVNPQVILVTLQKEQGFITGGPRSSAIYQKAMGYGCPDSSVCASKYYGFFNQVYSAASQFKAYRANPTHWNYVAGRNNNVLFHPVTTATPLSKCGESSVYVRNEATAGLYDYTPYQPNVAALAAGAGNGDSCSSYGNRNFWRYFTDWFGNPANLLPGGSFDTGSVSGWAKMSGTMGVTARMSATDAQSGNGLMALNTAVAGRSVARSFSQASTIGKGYQASIWVRSDVPGTPINGHITLWGLGGTTEGSSQSFTAGDTWTQVSTTLAVERSSHSALRLQVYVDTAGPKLRVDSAMVTSVQPPTLRAPIAVATPSFESGTTSAWKMSSGTASLTRVAATPTLPAENGARYMSAYTSSTAAIRQDIARPSWKTNSFTLTAWVRSGNSKNFAGQLALGGVGGLSETSRSSFLVGPQWTRVTTTLTMNRSNHTSLRITLILNTGHRALLIDNVSLVPNLAVNPSFESTTSGWTETAGGAFTLTRQTTGAVDDAAYGSFTQTSANLTHVSLDVPRPLVVGEKYTLSGWFRSADPQTPYVGSLRLIARGPDPSVITAVPISVGSNWTWVSVTMTVQSAQTSLRAELELGGQGSSLDVDGLVLD